MNDKELVAYQAARLVEDGMLVGLGTGSTANYFIEELARRKQEEGLQITAVSSSVISAIKAQGLGLPLAAMEHISRLDLYVDGADEVTPDMALLKGRGSDLVREKLLARAAESSDTARVRLARLLIESGVPADRLRVVRNAYAPPGEFLSRDHARGRLGLGAGERVIGWVGLVVPHAARLLDDDDLIIEELGELRGALAQTGHETDHLGLLVRDPRDVIGAERDGGQERAVVGHDADAPAHEQGLRDRLHQMTSGAQGWKLTPACLTRRRRAAAAFSSGSPSPRTSASAA